MTVTSASQYFRILVTLSAMFLWGCDSYKADSLSERSLIYCSEGSPEILNPQLVTSGVTVDATSKQLYNQLIAFDVATNEVTPSIAKSWHVTQDNKKITFYLRRNVAFHHTQYFMPTRHLNADDVLFSFNRILDPSQVFHDVSGGKYPFFDSVGFADVIESLEKINEYTIRFNLKRADSSFLANLATDFSVILSREYAELLIRSNRLEDIDTLPIGTGPYKFKEYRTGSYIRYEPHTEYWEGQPKLQQLIFDITPSNTGRLTKLLAGECDVIGYPIAHKKINNNPLLTLEDVTAFNIGYLGFNTAKPPFNNKLIRRAVAHAINKQAILDTVYFGDAKAESANSILPPSSWAYAEDTHDIEYSVEQAELLLTQAGITDGLTIDLWAMPVQRAYNPDAVTMAKLIQADLQKIGITVNIISYNWQEFLRRLALGEHQSVLLGWSADHPDPDNFFTPLLSCGSAETGNNRTFWCNQQFEKLLQGALKITDVEQRKALYREAQKIAAEELPLFPIAHSKRFQARKISVKGDILHPFGGISFGGVEKQ
ncbi:ABC transporter substrate-binding protein [Thalassotalea sp. 1_MG-2023]|uniref:ABC transporter substrate-binding protein n=1 Tax=Thalassotalea sp. 1_MG-2023 TaxID=3062680 RepID=UPI0026E1202E|nr:ABC transporter substrate-binding protein [Thalassotalea sp. 1_MG-2023]MDO6427989.1 ABC transporter substrate-binding protein [Thalassotalea sp. 1_MG-2023]